MSMFETRLLGNDPLFRSVIHSAQIVAPTDVTTLILGESGTGKELLAEAIHEGSRRNGAPFVAINCAALPESLVESELFGHARGAFTGAVNANPGRIRSAEGGTLFLDEIGELPLSVQAKLLRFLESGEIQAVGENSARRSNVRVIAATHRDLYDHVREGSFRQDLYYRLNVVPLELPPLRQRRSDISLLLNAFINSLAARHQLPLPRFHSRAMEMVERYTWPGNVRELRNFCERMVVLFAGREIGCDNLPREIREPFVRRDTNPFLLPEGGLSLEELEKEMIHQALARTNGNRSHAARLLGLSRDTLLYRIKKYALA